MRCRSALLHSSFFSTVPDTPSDPSSRVPSSLIFREIRTHLPSLFGMWSTNKSHQPSRIPSEENKHASNYDYANDVDDDDYDNDGDVNNNRYDVSGSEHDLDDDHDDIREENHDTAYDNVTDADH
ncbi:nonsense-mediated mRNA decay protein 2-like [Octopus sinensis]|uniref:Nonsense-mediated mRNA decay protein 2-like n=1 Tax=Octopus sinensis TaxID=2607531 RepID=A0A6P7SSP7_9MOLL|nr:nonsense-mediated mRNA decay protein 2-like [Octopus sinensis]